MANHPEYVDFRPYDALLRSAEHAIPHSDHTLVPGIRAECLDILQPLLASLREIVVLARSGTPVRAEDRERCRRLLEELQVVDMEAMGARRIDDIHSLAVLELLQNIVHPELPQLSRILDDFLRNAKELKKSTVEKLTGPHLASCIDAIFTLDETWPGGVRFLRPELEELEQRLTLSLTVLQAKEDKTLRNRVATILADVEDLLHKANLP